MEGHGQDINQKVRGITKEIQQLKEISERINTIPQEINIHKTIKKILDSRKLTILEVKSIGQQKHLRLDLIRRSYPVRLVAKILEEELLNDTQY